MSRDQRPARVKLVDSAPPAVPARRSDDAGQAASDGKAAGAATEAPPSSGVLYAAVFLIGCIIGGSGLSLLPLLGLR
jgi:hypothetical protein